MPRRVVLALLQDLLIDVQSVPRYFRGNHGQMSRLETGD
jgi:hypothetical protein